MSLRSYWNKPRNYLAVRCSYYVSEVGLVSYLWVQGRVNCVEANLRWHNSDINKGIYTFLCIVPVYNVYTAKACRPRKRSRYTDSLRAGRYGDRIPWGVRFSAPVQTALEPAQTPVQGVPCLFPQVKPPGRDVAHAPPPRAEVKERVKLYLFSPLWAFVVCSEVKFTFYLYL